MTNPLKFYSGDSFDRGACLVWFTGLYASGPSVSCCLRFYRICLSSSSINFLSHCIDSTGYNCRWFKQKKRFIYLFIIYILLPFILSINIEMQVFKSYFINNIFCFVVIIYIQIVVGDPYK